VQRAGGLPPKTWTAWRAAVLRPPCPSLQFDTLSDLTPFDQGERNGNTAIFARTIAPDKLRRGGGIGALVFLPAIRFHSGPPRFWSHYPPMRLSRFFLPILRETPKEAEILSHRL